MNASQNLRTAFWSLTVSFGLLLMVIILRPDSISPDHTIVKSDASVSHSNGRTEEEAVPAQLNDGRFFLASTTVAVESGAAGDSSRTPIVQLGSIEEVEDTPDSGSKDSQPHAAPSNGALIAQLVSLRMAVEQLKQSKSDQRAYERERWANQRKQTQQSQRLRELELQLKHLKSLVSTASDEKKADVDDSADFSRSPSVVPPKQPEAAVAEADTSVADRFSLKLRHAEITEVLELLGEATSFNIVIGEGVSGTVPSANLRDVNIIEALDGILQPLGFVYEHKGQSIYVMTKSEDAARKLDAAERDGADAR